MKKEDKNLQLHLENDRKWFVQNEYTLDQSSKIQKV